MTLKALCNFPKKSVFCVQMSDLLLISKLRIGGGGGWLWPADAAAASEEEAEEEMELLEVG